MKRIAGEVTEDNSKGSGSPGRKNQKHKNSDDKITRDLCVNGAKFGVQLEARVGAIEGPLFDCIQVDEAQPFPRL